MIYQINGIRDWDHWKRQEMKRAEAWDTYWRMVEATTFEEYLAGDLPKVPNEEIPVELGNTDFRIAQ